MPRKNNSIDNAEIGKRLELFVEKIGLMKKELAEALGTTSSRITDLISGKVTIYDYSQKILALGCNINWLISGDGDMFAPNEKGIELKRVLGINTPDSNVADVATTNYSNVPVISSREQIKEILREVLSENK